ncbi:MAG: hypothetical protein EOO47_01840, partial [Flavobacterium sp.]
MSTQEKIITYMGLSPQDEDTVNNQELVYVLGAFYELLENFDPITGKSDISFTLGSETKVKTLSGEPQTLTHKIVKNALKNTVDQLFLEAYFDFQCKSLTLSNISFESKLKLIASDEHIEEILSRIIFFNFSRGLTYWRSKLQLYKDLLAVNDSSLDLLRIAEPKLDEILINSHKVIKSRLIGHFIHHRNFDSCKDFLINELESKDIRLVTDSLLSLIRLNDLFVFISKEDIYSHYLDKKDFIGRQEQKHIEALLASAPYVLPSLYHTKHLDTESITFKFPLTEYGK